MSTGVGSGCSKALGHPVRLQIMDVLRAEPSCVCHLMAVLDRPQSYISQQLAVLREAGLVTDEKQGLNVFYRVRDRRVFELIDQARALLSDTRLERAAELRAAEFRAVRLSHCSCPKCQAAERARSSSSRESSSWTRMRIRRPDDGRDNHARPPC